MDVNLTLSKIAEIVGGNLHSADSLFVVKNISSLEKATDQDLAIILDRGDASVFDSVSKEKIKASKAWCFLTNTADFFAEENYILVKDSTLAFQLLVNYLKKIELQKNIPSVISSGAVVHPTAIIGMGSKIGRGTQIEAQVFVGTNCVIGSDVTLYPGVKILDGCIVGDSSIIHSGTVIGSDGFGYKITKLGMIKIPQIGIVRVGKFVEIGANCTIDRAAFDETIIGDGVKMDNLVHIAHNVKIGASTAILAQTGIAGSVTIGVGCQIGGQVAIKNDTKIGDGVKIVSKSVVMNDLEDGAIVCGIPAISFTKWKRISVIVSRLPELVKSFESAKHMFQNAGKNRPWYLRIFNIFKK
ncbi:MAG: UDP-3-O-acylglucosamine N-acyltransferase [candidate division TM6 bacterium GW2011_GWF2_37_49]|nr:MAG: UDP-3-O-acylglucosamine N-acyltransferase [candidate division TM6 bacterium GW2011_GWF2_37_49]